MESLDKYVCEASCTGDNSDDENADDDGSSGCPVFTGRCLHKEVEDALHVKLGGIWSSYIWATARRHLTRTRLSVLRTFLFRSTRSDGEGCGRGGGWEDGGGES